MANKLLSTTATPSALVLRLALGIVILAHGLQQTFGYLGGVGMARKIDYYYNSFGVPKFFGFLGVMIVSLGALLLILGFWTRIMAFLIGSFLTTAMFLGGHIHNGIFMNWEGQRPGEGFEYHILGIGIALSLFILGGGLLSIDQWLTNKHPKS